MPHHWKHIQLKPITSGLSSFVVSSALFSIIGFPAFIYLDKNSNPDFSDAYFQYFVLMVVFVGGITSGYFSMKRSTTGGYYYALAVASLLSVPFLPLQSNEPNYWFLICVAATIPLASLLGAFFSKRKQSKTSSIPLT